jgi:hypothetical protein
LADGLAADSQRLRKNRLSQDDLTAAFGYWIGYPSFLDLIACADWPEGNKSLAQNNLDAAHNAATHVLMHEAGKAGLDPHALYECGRVVEEIYRAAPERIYQRGTYDTWPECMGPWRYELPEGQQAALRNGEAVFVRLAVHLGIEASNASSDESSGQTAEAPFLKEWVADIARATAVVVGKKDSAGVSRLTDIAKSKETVDRRLYLMGKTGLLRADVSASELSALLNCSDAAVKKTRWWKTRMAQRRQAKADAEAPYHRKRGRRGRNRR